MKRILTILCILALVLSMGSVCVSATEGDSMSMSSVYLRTQKSKEGIYFGARFSLSQTTLDNMARYGLAVAVREQPATDADWSANMDGTVKRSKYTEPLTAKSGEEIRSTSLVNILHVNNDTMTNNRNANTMIYVRPYVELKDGSFLYGDVGSITMKQVAQLVDAQYNKLTDVQKMGLLAMYERFPGVLRGWGLTNLKADYTQGSDLLLQYRRDKVVENMLAQNNVLWSIDVPGDATTVSYSRTPSSKGMAWDGGTDPEDETYTLHEGRIYRGIPYTHGSASLDSFYKLGTVDANGVVTFENFNGSYFSGGSTNGSNATTGQYNMARLGNDCWDAIYWAWESVGTDVTADQTRQMTTSYGFTLLGEDILTEAMKNSGFVAADGRAMGDSLWDFICDKTEDHYMYRAIDNEITSTTNITGYYTKSTIMGLSSGTYTITEDITGGVDGTQLVTYATRTCTGLVSKADWKTDLEDLSPAGFDYQAMYETYTLAQKGDAMVHWSNSSGHAIMVIDINVVRNSDGTINGDESTVVLLEQASGHEFRQSKAESEYTITTLAEHNQHSDGSNSDCLYCAGYTDEVIDGKHVWKLDYGKQTRTFKQIAEDDYLAVTCDALVDPSVKNPVNRITDSKSGSSNVTEIYTGGLTATYRIDYVTLNVFDNSGAKINASTCFGIQNGVHSAFELVRIQTDETRARYGSVLGGDALVLHSLSRKNVSYTYTEAADGTHYYDEENKVYVEVTDQTPAPEGATLYNVTSKTTTTKWMEADLPAGSYGFTLSCHLGNGYEAVVRSGFFKVYEGVNPNGETVMLVAAE